MTGVVKFGKQLLQQANIINTGGGPTPIPAPQITPPPFQPIPTPQLQPTAELPNLASLEQARQKKLAATESNNMGRAATILTRRSPSRQRNAATSTQSPATYTNTVLGQ